MPTPNAAQPGERPHVSASQIETFRLCNRKWGIDKIDKVPQPGSKYTEFGTALHKVAEDYLRDGKPPEPTDPVAKIALAGKRYWPDPGTAEIEKYFRWDDGSLTVLGYMDIYQERARTTLVADHKSTGDFRWIKAPAELGRNVQANIYAYMALVGREWGDLLPQLDLQWIYYLRSRPQSRKVQLRVLKDPADFDDMAPDKGVRPEHYGYVTVDHVLEQWESVYRDGLKMTQLRMSGAKGVELEPNFSGCSAYGGCPYREQQCRPTSADYLRSAMEQQSIADKMAKMKARLKTEKKTPEETPAAQAPAAPQQSSDERAAAMKAKLSKSPPKEDVKKPALSVVEGGQPAQPKPEPKKARKAASPKKAPVNPPEAPVVVAATMSPVQAQAWALAAVLLKEQVATGQKPNAKAVAQEIQLIAKAISEL